MTGNELFSDAFSGTLLVSIDPGVDYYAWAEWRDGRLIGAGLATFADAPTTAQTAIIEKPQVYAETKSKGVRSSDIVNLSIAVGRLVERFHSVELVLPGTWKGQLPKKIHHERILAQLTSGERGLLEGMKQKELVHVLDAVGLGLYYLNRVGKRTQGETGT